MEYLKNLRPSRLIMLAILLAITLFLALNVLVTTWARASRVDLTANNLYTLSPGTRTVLSNLDEPLNFRLFLSSNLVASAPQMAAFANRVREMLESYTRLSKGKITMQVIDPKPFSDEEDRAVGLGINQFSVANGPRLFFGLAATNSTNGKGAIPAFSPEREPNLEYDLTRLVAELGQSGKPKVAIIDGLGLAGNPGVRMPPQQVNEQMRQFFDIETLFGDVKAFPKNTRVVMVVHPQNVSERTLYTLDQWVLGGGATMIFVDPYAETQIGPRPGMPPPNPSSNMDKFFKAWGVSFNPADAIGDPSVALRVARNIGGRQVEVANPQWLGLRKAAFAQQDPIMAELSNVFLTTAGSFAVTKDAKVRLKPLLTASAQAGILPAAQAGSAQTDPRTLMQQMRKTDALPILAARLEGTLSTVFKDGPPKEKDPDNKAADKSADSSPGRADENAADEKTAKPADSLTMSTKPLNIMLFGDADMLMDRNWVQQRQVFGQTVAQAFANNGDMIMNAVEQMAGGAVLAGLRGREIAWRPFERIEALERNAESKFLAKEQELVGRLREAEGKMRELSKNAKPGAELLNDESTKAIQEFRANILATRAELRDVQFNLRNDVETLKTWITGLNVGVVPAIVAVLALLFAMRRPRRDVPRSESPRAQAQA